MGKRSRGKLNEGQKQYLVQRLAQFNTPKEAAKSLFEAHGVKISPQSAEHYDPTKRAGKRLAVHLKQIFEDSRKRFIKYLEIYVPEANRSVRVSMLATAAQTYRDQNDYEGMSKMLVLIAKEVGNVFSNRRELTGKDQGPIKLQEIELMTEAQIDEELLEYDDDYDPDLHPGTPTEQ